MNALDLAITLWPELAHLRDLDGWTWHHDAEKGDLADGGLHGYRETPPLWMDVLWILGTDQAQALRTVIGGPAPWTAEGTVKEVIAALDSAPPPGWWDINGREIEVGSDVTVLKDPEGQRLEVPVPGWVLAQGTGGLVTVALQELGPAILPGNHLHIRSGALDTTSASSPARLDKLLATGRTPTPEIGDEWFGVRRRSPRRPVLGPSHQPPDEYIPGARDEVVHLVRVRLPVQEIPATLTTRCGQLTIAPGDAELVPFMVSGMPCMQCLTAMPDSQVTPV
ncbi:hypothetical protein [Kutzneria sp. 744]|uniref:hypothetical protein n=1 Tax=Kutzneria sp. (strain 744) TaxID=345341 RepID=UPI0003EEC11D|nr:hypothetical protein [Kutzneria sp. 744]EWM19736.1 hypothetical protein KUTG_10040 [Kutzneria sp. 744]